MVGDMQNITFFCSPSSEKAVLQMRQKHIDLYSILDNFVPAIRFL